MSNYASAPAPSDVSQAANGGSFRWWYEYGGGRIEAAPEDAIAAYSVDVPTVEPGTEAPAGEAALIGVDDGGDNGGGPWGMDWLV